MQQVSYNIFYSCTQNVIITSIYTQSAIATWLMLILIQHQLSFWAWLVWTPETKDLEKLNTNYCASEKYLPDLLICRPDHIHCDVTCSYKVSVGYSHNNAAQWKFELHLWGHDSTTISRALLSTLSIMILLQVQQDVTECCWWYLVMYRRLSVHGGWG